MSRAGPLPMSLAAVLLLAGCDKPTDPPPPPVDTTAPVVEILHPADGVTLDTLTVLLSGALHDSAGVARATYTVNGGAEQALPITPGTTASFSASLALQPGANTVRVDAFDAAGNRGTRTIGLTVVEAPPPTLALETVASGHPFTFLTSPPGDPRLFLVSLDGRIWIVQGGVLSAEPFLDLREKVIGGAHGLYSMAFHPQFSSNGHVYVSYVARDRGNRIERYTVGSAPDRADTASATPILSVPHPEPYDHYGGWIGFGPDGRLYVSIGDGGTGNSPTAQDPGTLLGSILRIDVDGGSPYSIPPDNPFVNTAGARPEIWATGLRNPWRASFDRADGSFYIADVGEERWEEINAVPAGLAGANYGWDRLEGSHCFLPEATQCSREGTVLPILEYPLPGTPGEAASSHPSGCSVTGGYVYRGSRIPFLQGRYLYGDFCRGWVRSFRASDGEATERTHWLSDVGQIVSFGEDAAGELYVLTFPGTAYRIVAGEP